MRAHVKTDQMRVAVLMWLAGVGLIGSASRSLAKPLYVLSDIRLYPGRLAVYDIVGPTELVLQGEYTIPQHGLGAVGIAIDSRHDTLFLTYEDYSWVRVIDAKTLKSVAFAIIDGAENLAGIVYDHDTRRVYCADRFKEGLYAFEWDALAFKARPIEGSPFTLAGSRSLGIALDEINDLLYVTNGTPEVRVYRTSDWSLSKTLALGHLAVSIAVDAQRQVLYTGAGYKGDKYLVRYDLASGLENSVEVDPNAGVIGVAVDDESGLVYVTTGLDNEFGGDDLKVYSPLLELVQSLHLGGNPTGLTIPLARFGVVPLSLTKRLVSGTTEVQGVRYAKPGDLLTYEICIENKGNRDSVTEVVAQDQLPWELDFVGVEGLGEQEGVYNPTVHAFTYRCNVLEPNATACFRLIAQVKEDAPAGMTLANTVTVQAAETDPTTATADVTVAYKPLQLSKRLVQDADDQVDANGVVYVEPGDLLTYEITVANPDNTYTIPDVIVVDTLPDQVTFVPVVGTDEQGYYDPDLHAYTCMVEALDPNAVIRFQMRVQVKDGLPAGTVITNRVLVNGLWVPPTLAEATAVIRYNALNVSKTIVSPVSQDGQLPEVEVGGFVTYHLCVDNSTNDLVTHNVSLIDVLPAEVDFVSAGLGGVFDVGSRVCRWTFPFLAPGQQQCTDLVVRVNSQAVLREPVINAVVAQGSESPPALSSASFLPIEASLPVLALGMLYSEQLCEGCSDRLMATLLLPSLVKLQDVDANQPLLLDPGGTWSIIPITRGVTASGNVKIVAFFERTKLLDAVDGYGRVTVTVKGWLRSGRAFVGQKSILITLTMRQK